MKSFKIKIIYKKDIIDFFLWVRLLGPGAAAVAIMLFLNSFFHGSMSGVYSLSHELQVWSWWEGFYGVFFSYGKGILFFCPLLVLSVLYAKKCFNEYRATTIFILTSLILMLLLTAPFSYWTDETWGVRKLVPIIPLLHIPLVFLFEKKNFFKSVCVSIIIVAAIYVQVLGVSYNYGKQLEILRKANVDTLQHMRFTPQFSHLAIHNLLLSSYLHKEPAVLYYTEKTWFRFTIGEPDVVVENIALDITSMNQPDIIWVRVYRYLNPFLLFAIVGGVMGLCSVLLLQYKKMNLYESHLTQGRPWDRKTR